MTDKSTDAARQMLAEIRASLEGTQTVLELSPGVEDDGEFVKAKQEALNQLDGALKALDSLATHMGTVSGPVLH